ncbi:U-box domain-containing protein [Thalictrum thalictroides]|uniref:U-box domain-containing protein n=1 Tax=Thalictrum thalictroides TaxID=46969 RepID=A0A7J6XED3_THATH|nr:U-box domain-containing protein [Thalictrum thalictroides]
MSDSSSWFLELRFFIRIRRFLKTTTKCNKPLKQVENKDKPIKEEVMKTESEEGLMIILQRSVKKLHFGSWEEKETATKDVMRLASKDMKTRKLLANLGVIPSLVSMLDSKSIERRRLAVQALIQLANGTYTNKALMVEAEILSKLPADLNTLDKSSRRDHAQLLFCISSLVNTQYPLSSLEVLPFLIDILDSDSSIEVKLDCLSALYNLSTMLENVSHLVSINGAVHTLLRLSSEKEVSEKALGILGDLVVSAMGKKAMENDPMVPKSLIEIMTWETKPKCQELAAYILMILAHQSSVQRAKMAKSGIVQVLLEVALLGSPLAQKRALKLLQWFKDERQTRIGAHSGPQAGRIIIGSRVNPNEIKEGKKIVKKMVKQSLNKNMEVIMRRANAGGDSSRLKELVICSSSKSLPY